MNGSLADRSRQEWRVLIDVYRPPKLASVFLHLSEQAGCSLRVLRENNEVKKEEQKGGIS